MITKNIPQIRFKKFEEAWEKKIFEDICTFGNGYTPSKAIDEYWENGTLPWYRMEDIRENGRILKDSIQHITPKAVKGKLFPANCIIMSTTATIGEHALLIADSLANQQFTFFIKNVNRYNYDDLFFFYKCYSIGEWCKKNANAGGLLAVNMPELKKLGLSFPTSISEQTRIASLFTSLDKQISTSEAKLDKLRTIKKTLLKKMFAAQGELTPQIRFKGFEGEWEEKKFSKITYSAGKKNKDNIPLESYSITNENGFIPQNEQFEKGGNMTTADKSMYYIVEKDSFAYNPARINVGSIGYYNGNKDVIVSSLYEVFKTTAEVNDRFLWHWLKSNHFYKKILQFQEGGVRLYFYYDKLCMCSMYMPTPNEQEKVGNLLSSLDKQISNQEQKIEKLKAIKKTLLKKMFV